MLLPQVPERCWQLIVSAKGWPCLKCRHPRRRVTGPGPWPPQNLQLLICEGLEKGLAAGFSSQCRPSPCPGFQMGAGWVPMAATAESKANACCWPLAARWLIAL